jgi:hypothetical protein
MLEAMKEEEMRMLDSVVYEEVVVMVKDDSLVMVRAIVSSTS